MRGASHVVRTAVIASFGRVPDGTQPKGADRGVLIVVYCPDTGRYFVLRCFSFDVKGGLGKSSTSFFLWC